MFVRIFYAVIHDCLFWDFFPPLFLCPFSYYARPKKASKMMIARGGVRPPMIGWMNVIHLWIWDGCLKYGAQ
jgi:hypothetical protein